MQPYIELNAHHIGKSHVQNGMLCEDFSATYSDDQVSIVVISDGHGDKNCFRSNIGARYACETAIRMCRQFQRITNHIDDIAQCDFESLTVSLESDIVDAWKERVLADADARPFRDEEMSIASEQAKEVYKSGQRLEKAYGCTLILSMSTASYWLSIQIGDGKSIAAYKDGVFVEPVPADENCLGNRSTSLCNSNAKESFRHYYSKVKPIAAFVSSDGVEESFDQAGLYNFFYSVAYWLKEDGFDVTKAKIDGLLPQISEGGSGDDVSIAIMVSKKEAIAKPRQTLDQIYERVNACKNVLERCRTLFSDTKDQLLEKGQKRSALEKDIAKLKEELAGKEEAYKQIVAEQDALQEAMNELDKKTQRASEQMEKATKYKVSAERYWFTELEKIGLKHHSLTEEEKVDDMSVDNDVHKEKIYDTRKTADEIVSLADTSKATVTMDNEEKTNMPTGEQENETELVLPIETDSSASYSDAIESLMQEEPPEEVKEKPSKHFWSFYKQIRK